MTMEFVEVMRNIYGASNGAWHVSAASAAIFTMMWNHAWHEGLEAADQAARDGASWNEQREVLHDTINGDMGWSDAEAQAYWSSHDGFTRETQQFAEAWDTFDAFVEKMRRGGR